MHFSLPTVLAAVEALEGCSHRKFDMLIARLGLADDLGLGGGAGTSMDSRLAMLMRLVTTRYADPVETVDGPRHLGELIVEEAVKHWPQYGDPSDAQERLRRGLAGNGFELSQAAASQPFKLRRCLPASIDLPAADDEVHALLRELSLSTPLGHLDQAIAAHTRGDWAAANGQIRAFMIALLDSIAERLDPATATLSEHERRERLAERFLSDQLNEWQKGGRPGYFNGLMKRLHPAGAHPGLSDEDDSTFRLHTVLIAARLLLRRLQAWPNGKS
jgi:hypothetical protein